MAKTIPVKFRPPKKETRGVAARVYVSQENLLYLTGSLDNGKPCVVEGVVGGGKGGSGSDPSVKREATLWLDRALTGSPDASSPSPVRTTDAFQDACGFSLSQMYRITVSGDTVSDADEIVLEDVSGDAVRPLAGLIETLSWTAVLEGQLDLLPDQIFPGIVFKDLFLLGPKRTFTVRSVNGRDNSNAKYVPDTTKVLLGKKPVAGSRPRLQVRGVEGMDQQVASLNEFLVNFEEAAGHPDFKGKVSCAVVLHGEHGTGKTMLLDRITATGWGTVHRIEPSDKLSVIQEKFQKAREQAPSIVTLDRFEKAIDKDRSNREAVIQALCKELDSLATYGPGEDADTPNVVVLVTCLDYRTDIPYELRCAPRLDCEIPLPLPDVDTRRAILASFHLPLRPETSTDTLTRWSELTHAYHGGDLSRLEGELRRLHKRTCRATCRVATAAAATTDNNVSSSSTTNNDDQQQQQQQQEHVCYLTDDDFDRARKKVRPTAMHDVNLKPKPMRWDDICGQEQVKRSLRSAVRLLGERPEALARMGLQEPKGILLYGPPGCSKTMVAQALATESGLNYFAVKGAELLNMYVGESERALRNLFQRARGAAPSMIFFDEIDAIGSQRFSSSSGGSGGGGTSSSSSSHSGLNVVTTLLTEMDGFEALKGVLVVAATNRPQVLDPALLRPGRFDELVYVPPPDPAACEAMLRAGLAGVAAHDDVDIPRLTSLVVGCSGAEIAGILRVAMRSVYERCGDAAAFLVHMADLTAAVERHPRMVTQEMLNEYRVWQAKFKA